MRNKTARSEKHPKYTHSHKCGEEGRIWRKVENEREENGVNKKKTIIITTQQEEENILMDFIDFSLVSLFLLFGGQIVFIYLPLSFSINWILPRAQQS